MIKRIKKFVVDMCFYIVGSFLFATAITVFISANEISSGGITGIATLLSYLFNIPSGIFFFLLNLPILILGFIKFGGKFIVKTAIASTVFSITLTVTDLVMPAVKVDKILAAVFGGLLIGAGVSIVMLRGATTGGFDILAKLVNKKYRHLTVGRVILLMDTCVVFFAAVVYKNLESALYSIVVIYSSSYIMDLILYGADKGKIVYIVTNFQKEICGEINNSLKRGATIIHATGGFTGQEKDIIMCTVRRHEVSELYSIVEKFDKSAFIMVSDAGEIIGEGFKALY